jgi:hypothetical protein
MAISNLSTDYLFISTYPSPLEIDLELQMRNNKSLATLSPNLAQSLTFKQLVSPTAKKVEGFDRSTLTQAFSSKVDKLRTKPKV